MPHQLTKLVSTTLTRSCYRALKDAILVLDLAPRTPLVEQQIATQLGVSKTPVREALATLQAEGFVVPLGRRLHVAGLSIDSIYELYGVRELLDPQIVRDATEEISDIELDYLDQILARGHAAYERGDIHEFLASNQLFHTTLVSRRRNQHLDEIYQRIYDHTYRVRAAIYKVETEFNDYWLSEKGFRMHEGIVDAMRARNKDLAGERMLADVRFFVTYLDSSVIRRSLEHLQTASDSKTSTLGTER